MATQRKDEVLDKAVPTDTEVIPRYSLVKDDGTVMEEHIALQLENPVLQAGMPYNAAVANEMLAASGTTTGSGGALSLEQPGFTLADGANVLFKIHTDLLSSVTLSIAGAVLIPLMFAGGQTTGFDVYKTGAWISATYSASKSAYIVHTTSGSIPAQILQSSLLNAREGNLIANNWANGDSGGWTFEGCGLASIPSYADKYGVGYRLVFTDTNVGEAKETANMIQVHPGDMMNLQFLYTKANTSDAGTVSATLLYYDYNKNYVGDNWQNAVLTTQPTRVSLNYVVPAGVTYAVVAFRRLYGSTNHHVSNPVLVNLTGPTASIGKSKVLINDGNCVGNTLVTTLGNPAGWGFSHPERWKVLDQTYVPMLNAGLGYCFGYTGQGSAGGYSTAEELVNKVEAHKGDRFTVDFWYCRDIGSTGAVNVGLATYAYDGTWIDQVYLTMDNTQDSWVQQTGSVTIPWDKVAYVRPFIFASEQLPAGKQVYIADLVIKKTGKEQATYSVPQLNQGAKVILNAHGLIQFSFPGGSQVITALAANGWTTLTTLSAQHRPATDQYWSQPASNGVVYTFCITASGIVRVAPSAQLAVGVYLEGTWIYMI